MEKRKKLVHHYDAFVIPLAIGRFLHFNLIKGPNNFSHSIPLGRSTRGRMGTVSLQRLGGCAEPLFEH